MYCMEKRKKPKPAPARVPRRQAESLRHNDWRGAETPVCPAACQCRSNYLNRASLAAPSIAAAKAPLRGYPEQVGTALGDHQLSALLFFQRHRAIQGVN